MCHKNNGSCSTNGCVSLTRRVLMIFRNRARLFNKRRTHIIMLNMCSPLFFKVFYNLGLDKKSFFLTVCSAAVQEIFVSFRISSEFNKKAPKLK